jgi:hypothetical protein
MSVIVLDSNTRRFGSKRVISLNQNFSATTIMASSLLMSKLAKRALKPALARRMSSFEAPLLLSPSKLRDLKDRTSDISILDVTWMMPNSPQKPRAEFASKRIPGAGFLDLDEVASTHELGLKHMMPPERIFADACGTCAFP